MNRDHHLKCSLSFLILTILLSWPIFFIIDAWIVPRLMAEGNSIRALFVLLGSHVLGMFAPGMAGYLMFKYKIKGAFPTWKWDEKRHYLLGLLFISFIWVVPAVVGFFIYSLRLQTSLKNFQILYMIVYLGTVWFASTAEEAGWCGFLLSYLSPRMGNSRALLISGIYRGIWHYPILISPILNKTMHGEKSVFIFILISLVLIIQLIISNVLFGAFMGYIWFRTESLPLVGWLHYLFDVMRDFSVFFIIGLGSTLVGKFGWAILFYGVAYTCLQKIMREEGLTGLKQLITGHS